MDQCLGDIGFRPLKSDPCVYIYEDEVGFVFLTLYVDDLLLLGANKLQLNKLKKQLMGRFEMTDMGDVSRILGMNVARDRKKGTIIINQREYTEDVIERFGMKGCNPAYTPGVGPELSLNQPEETYCSEVLLRSRTSGGGHDHHPLREHPRSTCRPGHQTSRQAPSPRPHQTHQRL